MAERLEIEMCTYCGAPLVIEGPDGEKLRFTRHDLEFCRDETASLLRATREALRQANVRAAEYAYLLANQDAADD